MSDTMNYQTGGGRAARGAFPDQRVVEISRTTDATMEAPVIQFDGAHAIAAIGGLVKFNLFQDRLLTKPSPDGVPVERVVCARLVMTPAVLKQLADWLSEHASDLVAKGVITTADPASGERVPPTTGR